MLAAGAEISSDRRAVGLAEAVVEASWQLLCHLNGGASTPHARRTRATRKPAVHA
jgi:hypothetical protein